MTFQLRLTARTIRNFVYRVRFRGFLFPLSARSGSCKAHQHKYGYPNLPSKGKGVSKFAVESWYGIYRCTGKGSREVVCRYGCDRSAVLDILGRKALIMLCSLELNQTFLGAELKKPKILPPILLPWIPPNGKPSRIFGSSSRDCSYSSILVTAYHHLFPQNRQSRFTT